MTKTPSGMSHYLYIEIDDSPYTLLMLLKQAENYIEKLCVPFKEIHNSDFNKYLIQEFYECTNRTGNHKKVQNPH